MKHIYFVIVILALVSLSCGMSVGATMRNPEPSTAPVPPKVEMVVTAGKLHIRNAPNGDVISYRLAGDALTVSRVVTVGDYQWCRVGVDMWAACEYLEAK